MFFEIPKKERTKIEDYEWLCGEVLKLSAIDFSEIKEKFTKEEFFTHICKLISQEKIPFPYFPYKEIDQKKKFFKLKNSKFNYTNEEWDNNLLLIGDKKYRGEYLMFPTVGYSGNSLSDLFTQKVRLNAVKKARKHTLGSVIKVWEYIQTHGRADNESVRTLLRCTYLEDKINEKTILRAARLSGQMVTQFRPRIAKDLYNFFGAKKVLDFSAGWGDRLVGFLTSNAESYIGIDPNTKLHEPYQQIVDFYNHEKKTRFICSPAEDVEYNNLEYDFVFTSPPYFDTEIYTEEHTQSMFRYTQEESWKEDFLFKTLNVIYQGLVEGGRIAINICDSNTLSTTNDLVDYMRTLGATFEGIVGYEINKRPGSIRDSNTLPRAEPIFIWTKGKAKEPKWNQDNFFGI